MAIARILFAAPLLALGTFVPGLGGEPAKPPPGAIGMSHQEFTSNVVTIRRGQTVTFVNNSHWVHTVGTGHDGKLTDTAGAPKIGLHLFETGDTYTTGQFNTPGTYYLTCSLHPEMTVKVVVTN